MTRLESEQNQTSAISLSRRLVRSPEDRVAKDRGERRVFEQIRVMPHEDIDVSGLVVLIGPDHGMIAHLDLRVRAITVLTYAGKHVNIRSRRLVPCVPFLVRNRKWTRHALHRGMRLVFDRHHAVDKCGDVLLEPDAAHELRKPRPHLEAVKLAQKRGVVEIQSIRHGPLRCT